MRFRARLRVPQAFRPERPASPALLAVAFPEALRQERPVWRALPADPVAAALPAAAPARTSELMR